MGKRLGLASLVVIYSTLLQSNVGVALDTKHTGYVQKITDGDTIWFNTRKDFSVETRLKIRMVHMDAPETHLPTDRKSTRLNSSHSDLSRMPSSA